MTHAEKLGDASIALAGAALDARANGDNVHAKFLAAKAADALALAKALGWKPDTTALQNTTQEKT